MLDRRGFLKFLGGAGVGIVATPVIWKGIDDSSIWSQNWPWVPVPERGPVSFVSTVSKLCPSGSGVKVRMVGDRPVAVHGNPEHPLGQSGVSPLALAEVQLLYSPARVRTPLVRESNGKYVPISWEKALSTLHVELKKQSENFCCISGDPTSSVNEVLSSLAKRLGSRNVFFMPGEDQVAYTATQLMSKQGCRLGFDFENSDMVFSIGANLLENWGTVVRNRAIWAKKGPKEAPAFRLAYASSSQDNTAACAEWWLPMLPGCEYIVGMGVAYLLIQAGKTAQAKDFEAFSALASEWTPEKVEEYCGLPAARLQAAVKALLEAKKPLVITGSAFGYGGSAAAYMVSVACNMLLGQINSQGGLQLLPIEGPVVEGALHQEDILGNDLAAYLAKVQKGEAKPGPVLFYEANPAYVLPEATKALLENSSFRVSFSPFLDETASQCDLVIPCAMGFERYDDSNTPYGCGKTTYSITTPVIAPLFEAQSAGEVLLELAKNMGAPISHHDYVDVLKAKAAKIGADWAQLSGSKAFESAANQRSSLAFRADLLKEQSPQKLGLKLAPVWRLGFGTPHSATPPYNVKLMTHRDIISGRLVAQINPKTAQELGLHDEQGMRVQSGTYTFEAHVHYHEGVMPGVLSLPAGLGHSAFDEFSQNKGVNVVQMASVEQEKGTELFVWRTADATVTGV